ncbi:hypothetical protein N480_10800 [Pseudoalteromonas luteoviolacea S2607]|nr:hypothetical protein N480_10800 [Pseudoalteromonas luteoviolacea S2607]
MHYLIDDKYSLVFLHLLHLNFSIFYSINDLLSQQKYNPRRLFLLPSLIKRVDSYSFSFREIGFIVIQGIVNENPKRTGTR